MTTTQRTTATKAHAAAGGGTIGRGRTEVQTLTKRQITALEAAFLKGGAIYGKGRSSSMGGAYRRMCERMAEAGLLSDRPPFAITLKGLGTLREIRHRGHPQKGPCMADLDCVEAIDFAIARGRFAA